MFNTFECEKWCQMTAALHLDELRTAIDGDRRCLCAALGLRADGGRFFCPSCQADGQPHASGDLSIEAGFKCHRCDWSGDGLALVRLVKSCDFPAALDFARGVYGIATPTSSARPPKRKKTHITIDDAVRAAAWNLENTTEKKWTETRRDFYRDAESRDDAAVIRFDRADGATDTQGKAVKSFRPLHAVADGWQTGDPPGNWPLFNLPQILQSAGPVFVCEGEKAASAGAKIGLLCTTTAHGAKSPAKTDMGPLSGRDIVLLPDHDPSGKEYAEAVAGLVHAAGARSVRIVELPGLPTKGDLFDFVALRPGQTPESIRGEVERLVSAAPAWTPPPEEESIETKGKPSVLLPAGTQSISDSGRALGCLLAKAERFFIRGGAVVRLEKDPDGFPHLEDVKPAALASDFETVAALCKATEGGTTPATCPEQTAKLIAASAAFRETMRPIRVLTRCPVLIERGCELLQVAGYDRESGILAAGTPADAMDLAEAVPLLREILAGFRFATPADHARALAAMITPALVFGGLMSFRAPVDLGEADASQTGKGYRNKLTAAIYARTVKTVTQRRAGTGSMEECFDMAMIRGANFVALDNIRGKIDSPRLESFLTEDTYHARGFHCEADIDPRRVVVMLTSNKADLTTDFSNRCACVRILKQPDGHAFTVYPEGDILEHVRENQSRYLAAVFAVIKAWHAAGKPRTTETRHDFRPWAQTMDWITRNLLNAGPLMDGHRETQARMTNPILNWLRDVALEVIRARQTGVWWRAGEIVDLIAETGIETPGLPEHGDVTDPETRKAAQQSTGRRLSLCFRAGDVVTLDGIRIERRETYDPETRYTVREYRFTPAADEFQRIAATPAISAKRTPENVDREPEFDLCGCCAADGASDETADKLHIAADAANTFLKGEYIDTVPNVEGHDIAAIGTISRISRNAAPVSADFEEGEI